MSVYFYTDNPDGLLNSFNFRITQSEPEGKITTWERSDDGKYYTHKAVQWTKKAWFQPTVDSDKLRFNIIKPGDANVTVAVYGYYHGHLIETFLNHFDKRFTASRASALPTEKDFCGS
jgi:hypothetical protein